MIIKKLGLIGLSLSLLSACSLQAHESVPAILPDNSSAARAEIVAIVTSALGGKKIPIAPNVFQESSRLLLTASPVTSPNGVKVYQKNLQPALVFELLKQGDTCLLKRVDTEELWSLKTSSCIRR